MSLERDLTMATSDAERSGTAEMTNAPGMILFAGTITKACEVRHRDIRREFTKSSTCFQMLAIGWANGCPSGHLQSNDE